MAWLIESFDVPENKLLADFDLDLFAARAVERLIGARPEVLPPDRIPVVAPLFDVDPGRWESVVGASSGDGVFGPDWLSRAVVHLVGKVVGQDPEELVGLVWPIPQDVAQGLLDRFAAAVRIPDGEVYIGFFGPPREVSSD